MTARILLAVSLLAVTFSAYPAWEAGAGLEAFRWVEYPDKWGNPRESGPRSALFLNWTEDGDGGGLFAWRAKLYGGTVSYDTFLNSNGTPVSTKTDYNGASSEAQMFYRDELAAYQVDYLGGLGLDFWRRSIRSGGSDQVEQYTILFARAGLRFARSLQQPGFHGEFGIKYPAWTRENAFLGSIGYTSNPYLSPKGLASGYAELGYRFDTRFDVVAYYDSWRFGRSADVRTNKPSDPPGVYWLIYQPKSSMDVLGMKLLVTF